jgi:hypothetical protein
MKARFDLLYIVPVEGLKRGGGGGVFGQALDRFKGEVNIIEDINSVPKTLRG